MAQALLVPPNVGVLGGWGASVSILTQTTEVPTAAPDLIKPSIQPHGCCSRSDGYTCLANSAATAPEAQHRASLSSSTRQARVPRPSLPAVKASNFESFRAELYNDHSSRFQGSVARRWQYKSRPSEIYMSKFIVGRHSMDISHYLG